MQDDVRLKRFAATVDRITRPLPGCLCLLLVGVSVAACFWYPEPHLEIGTLEWATPVMGLGADPARFLLQAQWLLNGAGFREVQHTGAYCTSLPPGYPLFLAGILLATKSLFIVQLIQCGLQILSGMLLFLAMRSFLPRFALFSGMLVSGSPPGIFLACSFMSETTGVFWGCVTLWLLFRILHTPASGLPVFAFGASCVAICLTSPGMAIVALAAFLTIFFAVLKSQKSVAVWCLLGALLPMMVWQGHCVNATGQGAPFLLHRLGPQPGRPWIATWARTADEYVNGLGAVVWISGEADLSRIPDHAFKDQAEKDAAIAVLRAELMTRNDPHANAEAVTRKLEYFNELAVSSKQRRPLYVRVLLPIRRAAASWAFLSQVDFRGIAAPSLALRLAPAAMLESVREFGIRRTLSRSARAMLSVVVLAYDIVIPGMFLTAVAYGLYSGNRTAVWMMASVVVFSFLHGYVGPEARRNLPVIPFVLCIPGLIALCRGRSVSCSSEY